MVPQICTTDIKANIAKLTENICECAVRSARLVVLQRLHNSVHIFFQPCVLRLGRGDFVQSLASPLYTSSGNPPFISKSSFGDWSLSLSKDLFAFLFV